jgi:hypothetical protein
MLGVVKRDLCNALLRMQRLVIEARSLAFALQEAISHLLSRGNVAAPPLVRMLRGKFRRCFELLHISVKPCCEFFIRIDSGILCALLI